MPACSETAYARVRVIDGREILLPISNEEKPEISNEILEKWQRVTNLASKALDVPAGLITHLTPQELEIVVASAEGKNPFKPGDSLSLGIGMYCETTTGIGDLLKVPDALDDDMWKNNPSVDFDMISYVGLPLRWPDGELFGTFCMLDSRRHDHTGMSLELLQHFRNTVEDDLRFLLEREELRRLNVDKDLTLREAHHRIKNHLNILMSVIQLRSNRGVDSRAEMEEFVKDISGRICAISSLHAQMEHAGEYSMDLGKFLSNITKTIVESIACCDVTTNFEFEPVEVSRTAFFHIGLLVSELVTNSLKHAFKGISGPEITLTLKNEDERTFVLDYRDNGHGIPDLAQTEGKNSVGMILIKDIPGRMGGEYAIDAGNGFNFRSTMRKQAV